MVTQGALAIPPNRRRYRFSRTPPPATYGQTIIAPAGASSLVSFSFWARLPAAVAFRGEVYAWDGGNRRAMGAALYESAPVSTTDPTVFQKITFTIPGGGAPVTAGQQYVLFVSTSRDQGSTGTGSIGAISPSVYAAGSFAFLNNGQRVVEWTTTAWDVQTEIDLVFEALFV